jgi:DNA-binding beta-propeller fold protein YncE
VDTRNNRVQKFTGDGDFLAAWGDSGSQNGEFDDPRGIAVDRHGNIYVSDTDNNRIQKFALT